MKELICALDSIAVAPRPRSIHLHPCAHCPILRSPDDEECVAIRDRASKADQVESVFACAWRREKLCKGYCDFLGVSEDDLRAAEGLCE